MNRVYQRRKEKALERRQQGWHGLGSFPNKVFYEMTTKQNGNER